MLTDRKLCVELYEKAECSGEVALFASSSREAYGIARNICASCPVRELCYEHVNPEEDGFTGTCAGRLYYDGEDVSGKPEVLPPPVFRVAEVSLPGVTETDSWEDYSLSTLMARCWLMRRSMTLNRVAKLSGFTKEYTLRLIQAFDDGSSSDFKDFIASQSS